MACGRSRGLIRDALLQVLLEKPLDKVTVTEVVARAGVSRVTYYRSFYSLHEVVDESLDELFGRIEAVLPEGTSVRTTEELRGAEFATYRILELYRENVGFLQPLLLGTLSSEVTVRMYQLAMRLAPAWGGDGGSASGLPPCQVTQVPQMLRTYVAAGMTAVIVEWLRGGCETPISEVLSFIIVARA